MKIEFISLLSNTFKNCINFCYTNVINIIARDGYAITFTSHMHRHNWHMCSRIAGVFNARVMQDLALTGSIVKHSISGRCCVNSSRISFFHQLRAAEK